MDLRSDAHPFWFCRGQRSSAQVLWNHQMFEPAGLDDAHFQTFSTWSDQNADRVIFIPRSGLMGLHGFTVFHHFAKYIVKYKMKPAKPSSEKDQVSWGFAWKPYKVIVSDDRLDGHAEATPKPLSRTISIVKPELACEVYAGKSLHLAFSWGETYRKNLASWNHYLFSFNCIVFTYPTWRYTVV